MSRIKLLGALLLLAASTLVTLGAKPRVVATFCLPADWVRQIAGDEVELTVLAPAGQDIHAFEPAPRDMAALAKADLVVEIGEGLEPWLDDMMSSTRSSASRVILSVPLDINQASEDEHEHGEEAHGGHHHHHGEYDPHVWMNPENVVMMGHLLCGALSTIDPDNAETYFANFLRWQKQLESLDQYAKERFGSIPAEDRVIITYHENLGYFAERYGIEVPGTILGSVSTEGGEPSARQMAQLIELIRDDHVKAVFTDPHANARLPRQICKEAELPAPQPLYIGTFATTPDGPQNYNELFRSAVDTIADSLQAADH